MSLTRTILVALTAFSVAMLPVAEAGARVSSPSSVSAEMDCPHGQHCDKHAKGDCANDAACVLKSANVLMAPLAAFEIAYTPSPLPKLTLVPGIPASLSPKTISTASPRLNP